MSCLENSSVYRRKNVLPMRMLILLVACPLTAPAGVSNVPGDFDHDCDVDRNDFSHFQACASGPSIPQVDPACSDAFLDGDADVDIDDFGVFQRCYSGEDNPADPNCNGDCTGGACDCLCGQTKCGGTCSFTVRDNTNCGSCGHVCDAGLTCQNGACASCAEGLTYCSGVCANTAFDTQNCGGCGHACADGETCSGGACQSPW